MKINDILNPIFLKVRKIFPVPKIENNIIVQKALRRAQNGRNPSKFLKQIAPINDPFIKNNMIRARPRRRGINYLICVK